MGMYDALIEALQIAKDRALDEHSLPEVTNGGSAYSPFAADPPPAAPINTNGSGSAPVGASAPGATGGSF